MNNLSKMFAVLLIVLACVTTSNAAEQQDARDASVLFYYTLQTKEGYAYSGKYLEVSYVGKSTVEPCSDLIPFDVGIHSGRKDYRSNRGSLRPFENKPVSAAQFAKYPGEAYTCFKHDVVIDGKLYSTGNVILLWDEANHAYIGADPEKVMVQIDA